MQVRPANIRLACWVRFDRFAQPLKAPATDVLKVLPLRPYRSRAIKVHRYPVLRPDLATDAMRQISTFRQGNTGQRHKRQDIGRADAGMHTLMTREIYQSGSLTNGSESSLLDRHRWSRKGHHGAIVIGVHVNIEHMRS